VLGIREALIFRHKKASRAKTGVIGASHLPVLMGDRTSCQDTCRCPRQGRYQQGQLLEKSSPYRNVVNRAGRKKATHGHSKAIQNQQEPARQPVGCRLLGFAARNLGRLAFNRSAQTSIPENRAQRQVSPRGPDQVDGRPNTNKWGYCMTNVPTGMRAKAEGNAHEANEFPVDPVTPHHFDDTPHAQRSNS
jgi:hypothetical protein